MYIEYKNKKIEKICTNYNIAKKRYGQKMAIKIHQRIDELKDSLSVEMMVQYRVGRCHSLKGDRKNQYALDLIHPYRLIFEKNGKDIHIVNIIEIVNYHDS